MAGARPAGCPRSSREESPFSCSSSCPPMSARLDDAPFERHLVPEADRRLGSIVLIPHDTQAGRSEQEVPARPRVEPQPARGEHSEKVAAREEQGVSIDVSHAAYDPIGARADLVRRLSPSAAVAK